MKLFWEGFQNVWYSEVAHDWRIWDEAQDQNTDQGYYDKPVNVFRAYLESIIAALSIIVPPVKCYPDDADNSLDLITARAGDQIAKLLYRHNDVELLWLHSLFIYCTEGMVGCYSYVDKNEKYGTYEEKEYKDENVNPRVMLFVFLVHLRERCHQVMMNIPNRRFLILGWHILGNEYNKAFQPSI